MFFIVGFISQWICETQEYYKCINKEYSTLKNGEGQDFNEWWLEIHDNFSTAYKTEISFKSGLSTGISSVIIFSYLYLLYKLFSSKNIKNIIIGFFLIIVTLICLFSTYIFLMNLKLGF